jgi:hypothetical protein
VAIDTSGRLGVANSTPVTYLQVGNGSGSSSNYIWAAGNSTNPPASATYGVLLGSNLSQGSSEANIVWGQGVASGQYLGIGKWTGSAYTEQMRIDSSGNVGIGTSTAPAGPHTIQTNGSGATIVNFINTTSSSGYGIYVALSGSAPNNTTNYMFYSADNASQRFTARSNGGLANFSANNVNLSDQREKTNFAPAGDYLAKICAIPVKTFNYIDQNMEDDPGLTLGVVAQDVQAVAPELVMESDWGTKDNPKMRLGIYQTDLQYALMKCIQEQQALITTLTDRITALEAK